MQKSNILACGIYKNLPYVVLSHDFGHKCGYIGLDKDHSWADMEDYKIPCECNGGITFMDKDAPFNLKDKKAEFCETKNGRLLYHGIKESEWNRVWIGFDTAHFWDRNKNWTNEAMSNECKSMIDQAVKYDTLLEKFKRFFLNKDNN
jgi:hypothetical protein